MRSYEGGAGLDNPLVDVDAAHMTTSWFETAHLPNADVLARPGSRLTASTAVTISNSFGSRCAYLRMFGKVLRSATRAIALDTAYSSAGSVGTLAVPGLARTSSIKPRTAS